MLAGHWFTFETDAHLNETVFYMQDSISLYVQITLLVDNADDGMLRARIVFID